MRAQIFEKRFPFRRYCEAASEAEKNEIPRGAEAILESASDLRVTVPNYLETLE